MAITIRILTPDDAEIYNELRLRALTEFPAAFGMSVAEMPSVEVMRTRLAGENSWIFGAFDGEQLVGMAGLHRLEFEKMRHKAEIWGMFVAPEQQGLGLGKALLQAAIDQARSTPGIEQLLLTVAGYNEKAKSMYAALGFEAWGFEPRAVKLEGEYYDDVQMCLML
ncbi:MAG: GNAT family N-acetyltransferase [Anaerolineales bacterium]|nr:GNAT family N-acetyltransferase [Anaerolineales bacterium]